MPAPAAAIACAKCDPRGALAIDDVGTGIPRGRVQAVTLIRGGGSEGYDRQKEGE